MARSYKKYHCCKGHNKFMKRYANKRVRQYLKNTNAELRGGNYRKATESYDICDYKFYHSGFESYFQLRIESWHNWRHRYEPFPDRDECLKLYKKYYVRK